MALERILLITRIAAILLAVLLMFQGLRILFVGPPVKRSSLQQLKQLAEEEPAPAFDLETEKSEEDATRAKEEQIANALSQMPEPFQGLRNTIRNAQVLGQLPRKQPPSLQAILGDAAIISVSGQPTVIKIGEEQRGVKLLKIAANRALIQHEGETNEITMFSGIGSPSIQNN